MTLPPSGCAGATPTCARRPGCVSRLGRAPQVCDDHRTVQGFEKEDARNQSQLLELNRIVLDLSGNVRDMMGQMKGIEKRLEDKDRLVEMTIKTRIMEEVDKLKAEFRRD
jgi:hypothetical protein